MSKDKQRDKVGGDDVKPPMREGAGRPTKYDPAMCEQVIECLAQGYSLSAAAGYIGISRQTLYQWTEENPEFSDAVRVGQAKAAIWWETAGKGVAIGEDGSAPMIMFGLKNRVRDDWADRREVTAEHSGKVQTEDVTPQALADRLAGMSPEDRAVLARLAGRDE